VRLSILEELERRDADGFRRWFAAAARPGGDPARYLATGPGA
jgi:antibiotic biosynthesis monooxygenase (ABM) superfamily enzyme